MDSILHPSIGANRVFVACALLLLAGCSEQALYSSLDEREANEMVATLNGAGLSASKRGDVAGGFSVSTAGSGFGEAVEILRRNGLPRERYESIGDVFAREGFVSSPLEERARLNFALSQEIAHTISSIDGVLMARVHLAVPQRDELDDTVAPASASVFVKHRNSVDLSGSVGSIKALVVNGIENLPYENVTVALFPSASTPVYGQAGSTPPGQAPVAPLTSETALAAVAPFAGPLSALVLLLAGGVCVWFGWFRGRGTRSVPSSRDQSAGRALGVRESQGGKGGSLRTRIGRDT